MKCFLTILLIFPILAICQPGADLEFPDMEPVPPDMPIGSFDLNGDSIPELIFSNYVVGTDDVPSSSGTWTIVVLAEEHCEILYDSKNEHGWASRLYWLQPQDTIPSQSSTRKVWQKRGIIEMMYMGYGGSATDGWVRSYQDVSDRIAVRFTQNDETWIGWVQWNVEPALGQISITKGEVWLVE